MESTSTTDVVIVGTGIMGAIVAREIRDQHPTVEITMIDAGPTIGSFIGQHMHDSPEPAVRDAYNKRVSSDLQPLYVGPEFHDHAGDVSQLEPGMYKVSAFGEEAGEFPGASLSWNAGGMSVHWTAATPVPWGDEVFDWGDEDRWNTDLARAMELLRVDRNPSGTARSGEAILATLNERYGPVAATGREPQPLPMAIDSSQDGVWPRTGPSTILPAMTDRSDDHLTIRIGTIVTELLHDGGHVSAVRLRKMSDGTEELLEAGTVIVCADALRTPQLLFASGIRPRALGRYLNEHGFISGRAKPSLAALEIDETDLPAIHEAEWRVGGYWLPHRGMAQPFNGEVSEKYEDGTRSEESYVLSYTWYVATEIREENSVMFSESESDAVGMPRMSFAFAYTQADREAIDAALAEMRALADRMGSPADSTVFAPLDPGASLHYTGTVRMGPSDDGTSVCSPNARVWGFDNLYVAGNGAIPTAVLCNTTLTGAITAVRAGQAVAEDLAD